MIRPWRLDDGIKTHWVPTTELLPTVIAPILITYENQMSVNLFRFCGSIKRYPGDELHPCELRAAADLTAVTDRKKIVCTAHLSM